jgi:molybdopterin-guanine dinucleotide biosynthesis protein A
MGGVDKGLQLLHGKPMVAAVIARPAPQVSEIIINANQNLDAYGRFGHRGRPRRDRRLRRRSRASMHALAKSTILS